MAEFFRLGLLTRLCKLPNVMGWADGIVEAEPSPHIALIELCMAGSQPVSAVLTLLAEVPGTITRDLPMRMLLGYSSRLVEAGTLGPKDALMRLYELTRDANNSDQDIHYKLSGFEDACVFAEDGVYGSVAEVERGVAEFLASYGSYSPDLSNQSA